MNILDRIRRRLFTTYKEHEIAWNISRIRFCIAPFYTLFGSSSNFEGAVIHSFCCRSLSKADKSNPNICSLVGKGFDKVIGVEEWR